MLLVEIVPAAVAAQVLLGVACGRILRHRFPDDAGAPAESTAGPEPEPLWRGESDDGATRLPA